MVVLKTRNVQAVSHLDTSESRTCIVRSWSEHFKRDDFALRPDFTEEEGILLTSWLKVIPLKYNPH